MQSGRKEENFNPFATVDWVAYQGAPAEGLTGTIQMQKWWSGTNCAVCHFSQGWFPAEIEIVKLREITATESHEGLVLIPFRT